MDLVLIMAEKNSTHQEESRDVPHEYLGGVRWRHANATWPFVRLKLSSDGLKVEPSTATFGRLVHLLGVPILAPSWSEIERIEEVKGVLPMSWGVAVFLHGKRLVWWCKSRDAHDAVMAEISRYVPEKVQPLEKTKFVL